MKTRTANQVKALHVLHRAHDWGMGALTVSEIAYIANIPAATARGVVAQLILRGDVGPAGVADGNAKTYTITTPEGNDHE